MLGVNLFFQRHLQTAALRGGDAFAAILEAEGAIEVIFQNFSRDVRGHEAGELFAFFGVWIECQHGAVLSVTHLLDQFVHLGITKRQVGVEGADEGRLQLIVRDRMMPIVAEVLVGPGPVTLLQRLETMQAATDEANARSVQLGDPVSAFISHGNCI